MNIKIIFFFITCCIFGNIQLSTAQAVDCFYSTSWYAIGLRNVNVTTYRCFLRTKNFNYNDNPTSIVGEHDTGKTDNDVGIFAIYAGNLLRKFTSIYCRKFRNLDVITTTDAQMESMDEDSLASCTNLRYLDVQGNKFRSLPEGLLFRNTKLKYFRLADALLTTMPENFFLSQRELEEVSFWKNQINYLPSDLFRPLVNLKYLYFNDNNLEKIDPQWFLKLQNLKLLGLYENQITSFPGNIFRPLKNLQELLLNDNRLRALDPNSFDGLGNLINLKLDNNFLTELPPNIFVPLSNLRNLSMSDNQLSIIHSDSFGTHEKLERFWINDNRIKAIGNNVIDQKPLKYFDLQNNICADFFTWSLSEVKPKLQDCLRNYEPRTESSSFIPQTATFKGESFEHSCGKPIGAQGNIIGGTHIARGAFPWIGAMVRPNGKFFCGCTLVSSRKAVTAAHCIQQKGSDVSTLLRDMLVLLGIHDLDNPVESGRASFAVRYAHMHDDWNPYTQSFDADIAVIVLDRPAIFDKHIQPVCLIPPGSDIAKISQSIVVGFGQSENTKKSHENIAKILDNPIHTSEKCFQHSPALRAIASGRTFCAGHGTGIGVCRGDSGSGVFVIQNGVFYLRGVVSSSLIREPFGCDVNAYAIFTDVAKYYNWISNVPVEQEIPLRR